MEPSAPRPLALLALLLLLGTGSYGTLFWLSQDRGPPPEAFVPAAEHIRSHHQAGDLIMLLPFYATRAREQLGDLDLVAPRDPSAEDLDIHARVWVFGLFGAAEKAQAGLERAGLSLLERVTPAPGISVDLYQNPSASRVVYDFVAQIKNARVFHEKGSELVKCAEWQALEGSIPGLGKWVCPTDKDWFYVGPEWHRMDDERRLCLWAHPPGEGRLVITFPNVPLAGRIAGHAGHTQNGSLYARAPIDLDVTVGTQLPQRFELALNENWRPLGLLTPVGTASVSFAISTPDAGTNHFCFALQVREAAPGR